MVVPNHPLASRGSRAEGVPAARLPLQAGGGGSTPTSALSLWLKPIDFGLAQALNHEWHSRLPWFGTGCIRSRRNRRFLCFGAYHDGLIYAVAIWSAPAARKLPVNWLELRRLAVAPDAPRNTASRMLAVMTRLIRRERPGVVRLISYQDLQAHTGSIYRAAGWQPTATRVAGEWDCPSRPRPKSQAAAPRQRWEKVLSA